MYFTIITFFHILYVLYFITVYMVLFLFNNVIYVFLLLCLCILIVCLCMATLTEVFPCFFLSCKANVRAKTGHGPHSSQLLCCMYCLFYVVLCIVSVYMCTVLPPSGGYPIAVNKYIISYPGQVVIKQPTYPLYVTEQNITRRANRSNASKTAQLPRDHLKTT